MLEHDAHPNADEPGLGDEPEAAEVRLVGDCVYALGTGCRWLRSKPSLDWYEMKGME
jgi:hypothetical protein